MRPIVYRDVIEIINFIGGSSVEQADRFAIASRHAMDGLIAWPGPMSQDPAFPDHPRLSHLRRYNLRGVANHSMLFSVQDDLVEVDRCLHASRMTRRFLRGLR